MAHITFLAIAIILTASFQQGKIFVFNLNNMGNTQTTNIFMIFFVSTEPYLALAVKCFSCDSYQYRDCGSPFDNSSMVIVDCSRVGVCLKVESKCKCDRILFYKIIKKDVYLYFEWIGTSIGNFEHYSIIHIEYRFLFLIFRLNQRRAG